LTINRNSIVPSSKALSENHHLHNKGEGWVQFTRSSTKGEEQHERNFKIMTKNTRKDKTTRKKTISNTTKKERGGSIH